MESTGGFCYGKRISRGKTYKIFFEGKDCVIAETELGDIVIAFSENEYYSMSNDEIEQKIYDGIKSREK